MSIFNIPGMIPSSGDITNTIPIGISAIGTPVFDDVTFPPGKFVNLDGDTIEYPEFKIQSGTVTVTQAKRIVRTYIAGRDGSIKEYINKDDYSIKVSGKITELLPVFPHDQLISFVQVKDASVAIPVKSKFLNSVFDIFDVVISDISINTIEGSLNEVGISISMLSDEEFNINDYVVL